MTKKRKKVGKEVYDILSNPNIDTKQSLMDTSNEMSKNMIPEVEKCILNHKHWTEPFYIVVINKRERLLINAIRQYFLARQSLPTPDLDQTVFKYTPSNGDLEYLWTVPDKNSIEYMIAYENVIPLEQKQLLEFCKLFKQGKLAKVFGK